MIATLEFELPKDQEDFEVANKALNFYLTLDDLNEWLREKVKYDVLLYDPDTVQAVRDKLYEIMEERDASLDIIS